MRRMIVDTPNLLFRVASAHGKYNTDGTPEEQAGLAMHMALNSLNKHFKKINPDHLTVVFEGGKNWRKDYTRSAACVSKKGYKANRIKDASFDAFFELIKSFEELVRNHTSVACLSHPMLEGDDLIGGYTQMFASNPEDEIIILSGDKDFAQLLRSPNVQLINPDNGKPRKLVDICGVDDPDYFMFEKCFRGDKGDNVWPAYPRVRATRLKKAYSDEYELTKIMNETWKFVDPDDGTEIVHSVAELFEENNLLMNLSAQPDNIKQIIKETLEHELTHHGKYSHFHFTKFCGKFGLKQIADNAQAFANMFNITGTKSAPTKKPLLEF